MNENQAVPVFISIVFLFCIVLAAISIVLIISKRINNQTKLFYKFVLGIVIMIMSFLGGFTIGAYTIFFAIALWFHIITNNYKDFKIRIASGALLAITLIETWFLTPG